MQYPVIFAVLLIYGLATIDCFLFKEYGNLNKPLIGIAKFEIKNDGAMQRVTFPEVSCENYALNVFKQ